MDRPMHVIESVGSGQCVLQEAFSRVVFSLFFFFLPAAYHLRVRLFLFSSFVFWKAEAVPPFFHRAHPGAKHIELPPGSRACRRHKAWMDRCFVFSLCNQRGDRRPCFEAFFSSTPPCVVFFFFFFVYVSICFACRDVSISEVLTFGSAAGEKARALLTHGSLYCWGAGNIGQAFVVAVRGTPSCHIQFRFDAG